MVRVEGFGSADAAQVHAGRDSCRGALEEDKQGQGVLASLESSSVAVVLVWFFFCGA